MRLTPAAHETRTSSIHLCVYRRKNRFFYEHRWWWSQFFYCCFIFRPSGISPVSTFVCATTFRIPYNKLRPLSNSIFFSRAAYDVYILSPPPPLLLLLLLLSLALVFRKSVSRRRQLITTSYFVGRPFPRKSRLPLSNLESVVPGNT